MSESLIFAHFLFFGERCEWIAHFAQIKWAMWANRSGRSPKMSDHERFAQVAQRKWAIVSESLRSLTKNERMSELLIFLSESLICSFLDKKLAIRSENRWANSQPWFQTLATTCDFRKKRKQCSPNFTRCTNAKYSFCNLVDGTKHPLIIIWSRCNVINGWRYLLRSKNRWSNSQPWIILNIQKIDWPSTTMYCK